MQTNTLTGAGTKAMVCVDSLRLGDLHGRLYAFIHTSPIPFYGVVDLLRKMDCLYDSIAFPLASFAYRSFESPSSRAARRGKRLPPLDRLDGENTAANARGSLGSFCVQVKLRQNASWQGEVRWMETGKEASFISALQFVRLMQAALAPAMEGASPPRWGDAAGNESV